MDLITEWMVWVFYQAGRAIGFIFITTIRTLILRPLLFPSYGSALSSTKRQKSQDEEAERMAGCKQVVLEFAEALGSIAREAISRDELEQLIDAGIEPQDLAQEIHRRIEKMPGVMLGHIPQPTAGIPVKLPDSLRDRHMYIIGRSGSGKTNLIRLMALQDIHHGHGIGMIAPEQELLTEEILPYIPEERIDDVVYFNPANAENPIPLNPLYLDEESDIDLCVDDNMTVFKRLMGESQPRMDEILRQSLYALLERPNSTLLDVERLLSRTDDKLRTEIIRATRDEQTKYFFESTYPSFPKDAHLPIVTRINRLVRPRTVRNLLCQPGKSFSFREAMDEGKILLFNLSDGILGEQTAQLLGQLIVSKIQLATLSRMDTAKAERRPFYFYLDEFQTYVGVAETSYGKLLSRGRKYAFGLILAHQQTSQLTKPILDTVLGNVTTMITFSVAYADAMRLGQQYIMSGNRKPLPAEEFVSQKVGEAIGKIGQTVFPLHVPLAPQQPNHRKAEYIIQRSAQNYGLHSYSRTMWEVKVKRVEPKLLPVKGGEEPPDPDKVF
jgi:Type IV secretion-system coupling protein DNA-binding domain